MLWVVDGGTAPEHETFAKAYWTLNDAAVGAFEQKVAALDPDIRAKRRMLPDARTLPNPIPEDHPTALKVVGCLLAGEPPPH